MRRAARPRKDWNHICNGDFFQPPLYTWALRLLTMHVCTRMVMDWKSFAWLRLIICGGFRWSWGDFLLIVVFSYNDVFWRNIVFSGFIFWFIYKYKDLISIRGKYTTPMHFLCISSLTPCISVCPLPLVITISHSVHLSTHLYSVRISSLWGTFSFLIYPGRLQNSLSNLWINHQRCQSPAEGIDTFVLHRYYYCEIIVIYYQPLVWKYEV